MADPKLFAGPRMRRLRLKLGLSQTAMAGTLAISPSYLNLIERNQRPITAQLLIKLAEVHDIDPREVKGDTEGLNVAGLRQIFSDPLLSQEMPSDEELMELSEAAPNVASGITRLHASWVDAQTQLAKLTDFLAADDRGEVVAEHMLPKDSVEHFFTQKAWYFEPLENLAMQICEDISLNQPRSEVLAHHAKQCLKDDFELRVQFLPSKVMLGNRRRLDRHTGRVFVDAALPATMQNFEIICAWLQLSQVKSIQALVANTGLEGQEVYSLLANEFVQYLALAILAPMDLLEDLDARSMLDVFELANRQNLALSDAGRRLLPILSQMGVRAVVVLVSDQAELLLQRASMAFPVSEINKKQVMGQAIIAFSSPDAIRQKLDLTALENDYFDVFGVRQCVQNASDTTKASNIVCIFAREVASSA